MLFVAFRLPLDASGLDFFLFVRRFPALNKRGDLFSDSGFLLISAMFGYGGHTPCHLVRFGLVLVVGGRDTQLILPQHISDAARCLFAGMLSPG
ncbi:hypothetical protein [Desulfococcus multivorans]|uniref:hypothetical protein n=1 Tax=Desulfococcus multivorans TaxID=897 RepID=UPI0013564DCC|nr:hypothetical protein [Desulfococcus multivorans]